MTIRDVAYSYSSVAELEQDKEKALLDFWEEIVLVVQQRNFYFNTYLCKSCGRRISLVRAFHDDNMYIDSCKHCDQFNMYRIEDSYFIDNYSFEEIDNAKYDILENVWLKAIEMIETRLLGNCIECGHLLKWEVFFSEQFQYGCKCPNCGKGYWQQSY